MECNFQQLDLPLLDTILLLEMQILYFFIKMYKTFSFINISFNIV